LMSLALYFAEHIIQQDNLVGVYLFDAVQSFVSQIFRELSALDHRV
jgi:hypothetical protein